MCSGIPISLNTGMHAECHIAACTIWPCSQQLGLHHAAYVGDYHIHCCAASGRVTFHPAPLPCGPREDGS